MRKFVINNKRSLMYSSSIIIGLIFLINIEQTNRNFFVLSAITLYTVILFEISYIWFISREKLKQLNLPLISDFSKFKQFLHHLLLPTFFFFSKVSFIYYNNQASLHLPILILSFVGYTALFINLRAFYQDKFSLEERTYFVYDMIELATAFTSIFSLLNAYRSNSWDLAVVFVGVFLINFSLLILNLYQLKHIDLLSVSVILLIALVAGAFVYIIIELSDFNELAISSFGFLYYYLSFGILTHKLDGSLTREVIFEYISIFLLTLAFLFGIN